MIIIMVIGTIQVGSMQTQEPRQLLSQTKTISFDFSVASFTEEYGMLTVQCNESMDYRNIPGEPLLPILIKTFEFPFGTSITNIECSTSGIYDTQLSYQIQPAVSPVTDTAQPMVCIQNTEIYTNNQLFPDAWYSYHFTGGLNRENILKTFLTIQINLVRYNPVENYIRSLDTLTIEVTYEHPIHPFAPLNDAYDMVIICFDDYASLLEPLVTHKNSHGIRTQLVTLTDIKDGTYFPADGRDTQEQIKYFIKNAKETWNITYVMLVGNYAQMPIRYSYITTDPGTIYEELRFVSDLYYADLYTANGSFCSWDTDNDGLYSEWSYSPPKDDFVDFVPDVYVGRLACMVKSEVKTMVEKIITYENTAAGSDWFNRMVVAGGDTYEKSIEGGTDYNEGEAVTGRALEIMSRFTPVKLWMSLGNLTTSSIQTEINKGCGFLFFAGHGNPRSWATHNNGDYLNWSESFGLKSMFELTNTAMYPILLVGGCHNSEIDVAPINLIKGFLEDGFHYFSTTPGDAGAFWWYNWVPECWSWVFLRVQGGAIASLGSSGYGCDEVGDGNHDGIPDCTQYYDGWLALEFLRLYNQQNMTFLGQAYSQAVAGYVQQFPVKTNRYDAKVIQTHVLLGDPSLKIGGYE